MRCVMTAAARPAAAASLLLLHLAVVVIFPCSDAATETPAAGSRRRDDDSSTRRTPKTSLAPSAALSFSENAPPGDDYDHNDDDDSQEERAQENVRFAFVDAPAGRVRGKLQMVSSPRRGHGQGGDANVDTSSGGVHARAFLGIPFAKPPVGELRFASPVPTRRFVSSTERRIGSSSTSGTEDGAYDDYYDATTFAPACLQLDRPRVTPEVFDLGTATRANIPVPSLDLSQARDDPRSSEDCLYLNVWTPTGVTPPPSAREKDRTRSGSTAPRGSRSPTTSPTTSPTSSTVNASAKNASAPAKRTSSPLTTRSSASSLLPVMVWIHGGSFQYGATSDPGYDGASLAVNSNVVVVSVAYRLGPFGFLRHEALRRRQQRPNRKRTSDDDDGGDDDADDDADDGNWGLQDQRVALRWVRRNIEAFGGDPDSVLLFGGSAGAVSVCLHLISPRSCGLFAAAAMHSGYCDAAPPNAALECGASLAAAAGCRAASGRGETKNGREAVEGTNNSTRNASARAADDAVATTASCLRSLGVRGASPFWSFVAQSYRLAAPNTGTTNEPSSGDINGRETTTTGDDDDAADDDNAAFNVTMSSCFTPSYGGSGGANGRNGIGSAAPEETMLSDPRRVCKVPVIMGTTAEEGTLFMPALLAAAGRSSVDFDGAFIEGLLRGALGVSDPALESELAASYGVQGVVTSTASSASAAGENNDRRRETAAAAAAAAAALVEPRTQFAATTAALGDWLFKCPTVRAARALSSAFIAPPKNYSSSGAVGRADRRPRPAARPRVFVYAMDVIRRCNPAPAEYGVMHGSDYGFIFANSRWPIVGAGVDVEAMERASDEEPEGTTGWRNARSASPCEFTPREIHLSRVMRMFWRNIASTGDPNLSPDESRPSGEVFAAVDAAVNASVLPREREWHVADGAGQFRPTVGDVLLPDMPEVPHWPSFFSSPSSPDDVDDAAAVDDDADAVATTAADQDGRDDEAADIQQTAGAGFFFDVTDPSGVGRSLPAASLSARCELMLKVPTAYSRAPPPSPRPAR